MCAQNFFIITINLSILQSLCVACIHMSTRPPKLGFAQLHLSSSSLSHNSKKKLRISLPSSIPLPKYPLLRWNILASKSTSRLKTLPTSSTFSHLLKSNTSFLHKSSTEFSPPHPSSVYWQGFLKLVGRCL